MDGLFFMNPRSPARRAYYPNHQPSPTPAKPKVVSIPVHFLGSDDATSKKPSTPAIADPSAAALKIQRATRGFLVRKNLRTARRIAAEAEEIARRIADEESIRRDAKEQVRVGEMLMNLLLRLDSVRGVREYRKKVIRRVIQLQEAVDSIVAAPLEATEAPESMERRTNVSKNVGIEDIGASDQSGEPEKQEEEEEEMIPPLDSMEESLQSGPAEVPGSNEVSGDVGIEGIGASEEGKLEGEATEESPDKAETESITTERIEETDANNIEAFDPMAEETSELTANAMVGGDDMGTPNLARSPGNGDEMQGKESWAVDVGMREVMERVAAEGKRMKEMVAELCERSAAQCRVMGGLAQRVEQLERTMQRMEERRRKKRRATNSFDKKSGAKRQ